MTAKGLPDDVAEAEEEAAPPVVVVEEDALVVVEEPVAAAVLLAVVGSWFCAATRCWDPPARRQRTAREVEDSMVEVLVRPTKTAVVHRYYICSAAMTLVRPFRTIVE